MEYHEAEQKDKKGEGNKKMKNIKLLGIGALALASTLTLVACGGGSNTPSGSKTEPTVTAPTGTTATTAAPTGDKTITFWHAAGDKNQKIIDTAIAKFKEKYGWDVKQSSQGGYDGLYKAVITGLTANDVPDIAMCYSDHIATYLSSEKVVDLSSFINSTATIKTLAGADEAIGYSAEELADFVESFYAEGKATTYGDYETYGYTANSVLTMPLSKSTEIVYYNKDVLDELNIAEPQTWDDIWAACAKIKNKYPESTPFCYDSEANWFITMCEQNGWGYTSATAPHYLFNAEPQQNFLTTINGYYDRGYIHTQTTYNAYTSGLFTKGGATGCTFCIGSSGGATYQDPKGEFNWGVCQVPASVVNGQKVNKCISQGPSVFMFNNGKDEKVKMTWLFMKELLEPEFQAKYSIESGYNPVRKSVYEIEEFEDFLADEEDIKAAVVKVGKTLSENNAFYVSPAFPGSASARIQVGSALVYALTGQKTPAKALKDAIDSIV